MKLFLERKLVFGRKFLRLKSTRVWNAPKYQKTGKTISISCQSIFFFFTILSPKILKNIEMDIFIQTAQSFAKASQLSWLRQRKFYLIFVWFLVSVNLFWCFKNFRQNDFFFALKMFTAANCASCDMWHVTVARRFGFHLKP